MSILEEAWTAGEVAEATGLTSIAIQNWAARDLILGGTGGGGKGRPRFYDWGGMMQIAAAAGLMEVGMSAPQDAFKAASRFSHFGKAGAIWEGEERNPKDSRRAGLPYHHSRGTTLLFTAGEKSRVELASGGPMPLLEVMRLLGNPPGMVCLNLSSIFAGVVERLGLDPHKVLDDEYARA